MCQTIGWELEYNVIEIHIPKLVVISLNEKNDKVQVFRYENHFNQRASNFVVKIFF